MEASWQREFAPDETPETTQDGGAGYLEVTGSDVSQETENDDQADEVDEEADRQLLAACRGALDQIGYTSTMSDGIIRVIVGENVVAVSAWGGVVECLAPAGEPGETSEYATTATVSVTSMGAFLLPYSVGDGIYMGAFTRVIPPPEVSAEDLAPFLERAVDTAAVIAIMYADDAFTDEDS